MLIAVGINRKLLIHWKTNQCFSFLLLFYGALITSANTVYRFLSSFFIIVVYTYNALCCLYGTIINIYCSRI